METLHNIIQAVSDARYWLMPLILACLVVILYRVVRDVLMEEME